MIARVGSIYFNLKGFEACSKLKDFYLPTGVVASPLSRISAFSAISKQIVIGSRTKYIKLAISR